MAISIYIKTLRQHIVGGELRPDNAEISELRCTGATELADPDLAHWARLVLTEIYASIKGVHPVLSGLSVMKHKLEKP